MNQGTEYRRMMYGLEDILKNPTAVLLKITTCASKDTPERTTHSIRQSLKHEPAMIVAPEYSYFPMRCLTAEEKEHYQEELKVLSTGKRTLLIPGSFIWTPDGTTLVNTTSGICNGQVLFEYQKRHNGGESEIAKTLGKSARFGNTPGFFTWNNRSGIVDICVDHANSAYQENVDLHIVIASGYVMEEVRPQIKEGGWFLYIDGQTGGTIVSARPLMCTTYHNEKRVYSRFTGNIEVVIDRETGLAVIQKDKTTALQISQRKMIITYNEKMTPLEGLHYLMDTYTELRRQHERTMTTKKWRHEPLLSRYSLYAT